MNNWIKIYDGVTLFFIFLKITFAVNARSNAETANGLFSFKERVFFQNVYSINRVSNINTKRVGIVKHDGVFGVEFKYTPVVYLIFDIRVYYFHERHSKSIVISIAVNATNVLT